METLIGWLMGLGTVGAVFAVIMIAVYGWALKEAKQQARGKADAEREEQYRIQPYEPDETPGKDGTA